MAEAITYADLRFVKAPLKKSVSSRLGQDLESDEDGELTYENVQVPPGPGGPLSLASSGLGGKAGVQSEQAAAAWSSVTSPAARQILPCHAACLQYLLLGLLLTCLLLGVAAICLGVRYLQVSQQLQQMNRVLEATNSSLRQQLHLKITQLGQREEDLQGSRRELAQSQETLQVEQKVCQATKEQLQACESDGEKTKEDLRNKEAQRMDLEQRLHSVRDTLKPIYTCPSPGFLVMVKTKDVPGQKGHGQTCRQRTVILLFPPSVRGQLSRIQTWTSLGAELDTHASKSLCPSSLTWSLQARLCPAGDPVPEAGLFPGKG
ncbi:B-cell differentiation antigen CD72 isoform X3 [Camelus ferus]|uniref:B-cell differentiation antigen CD72 isoform X3 n=1 Tax=Camelus ferus TaxID=419612 RepID=A0A8B8SW90_CAMFR|nr:B-cell differentiation antigen CD72 isoform X3 [Camelus ferus]